MLRKTRDFISTHERRLSALGFALGFFWDTLTLTRIDRLFEHLVLGSYLLIALASIMLINARGAGRLQGGWAAKGVRFFQFLLPFAFGGLFSGFLIFYSRSGSVIVSAPFLIILAALFAGNELFRRHYERFVFQLSVFFVALFSYSALLVPVLLRRIGAPVFLASGLVALILFYSVTELLKRVAPLEFEKSRRVLFPVIGMLFVLFSALYFNNMIPPIPLSLQEIGVYHAVERIGGEYALRYEQAPWYAFGAQTSRTFHRVDGEPAYVFSSVYAPIRLAADIRHRWSYYDRGRKEWVTANLIRFSLAGGRSGGFRGYSVKENLAPGKWRVDVETLRGQVIGRFTFTVATAGETPELAEAVR